MENRSGLGEGWGWNGDNGNDSCLLLRQCGGGAVNEGEMEIRRTRRKWKKKKNISIKFKKMINKYNGFFLFHIYPVFHFSHILYARGGVFLCTYFPFSIYFYIRKIRRVPPSLYSESLRTLGSRIFLPFLGPPSRSVVVNIRMRFLSSYCLECCQRNFFHSPGKSSFSSFALIPSLLCFAASISASSLRSQATH